MVFSLMSTSTMEATTVTLTVSLSTMSDKTAAELLLVSESVLKDAPSVPGLSLLLTPLTPPLELLLSKLDLLDAKPLSPGNRDLALPESLDTRLKSTLTDNGKLLPAVEVTPTTSLETRTLTELVLYPKLNLLNTEQAVSASELLTSSEMESLVQYLMPLKDSLSKARPPLLYRLLLLLSTLLETA